VVRTIAAWCRACRKKKEGHCIGVGCSVERGKEGTGKRGCVAGGNPVMITKCESGAVHGRKREKGGVKFEVRFGFVQERGERHGGGHCS